MQRPQTAFAALICCSAGPIAAMGKNRSGSSPWQAPRDIQSREPAAASNGSMTSLRKASAAQAWTIGASSRQPRHSPVPRHGDARNANLGRHTRGFLMATDSRLAPCRIPYGLVRLVLYARDRPDTVPGGSRVVLQNRSRPRRHTLVRPEVGRCT